MESFLTSSSCRGTVDTQELQAVALFEKCRQFTKARELQTVGLYPYFNPISESEDTVVVIDGQKRIMLGSNNYLGLTHHPKVLEAATRAEVMEAVDTTEIDLLVLDGEATPAGGLGIARQLKDEVSDCPPTCVVIARAADRWLAAYA